ncbi:hypothetical protein ACOMHN_029997 [Nucella lapillus]
MFKFKFPWDGRVWNIRQSLHCKTPNVIYCIICRHHPDFLYIGSSVNLRHRWASHKSDCKLRKGHKCHVAQHFLDKQHPVDPQFTCLRIFAIEAVHKKENLADLLLTSNEIIGLYDYILQDGFVLIETIGL